MRKTLLAAGIGLLAWAGASQAAIVMTVQSTIAGQPVGDFFVDVDKQAGSSGLAGFDIYRYFARFSPTSATGTLASGLQSVKVNLLSDSNMKFKLTDLDFDGENDADIFGQTIPDAAARTNNTTIGSIIRVNPFSGFSPATVVPTGFKSDTDSNGIPDTIPTTNYAAVKSFRVEGFEKNPPDGPGFDPTAKAATGGALFAIQIVPTGGSFGAVGSLAADKGPVVDFNTIPEPTTMSLLGIGAVSMLARRRRTA